MKSVPATAGDFVFRPIQILLKFEADVVDRREDFHLRLRKHGVAQHVAAGVFGDEALPFMVHEDEAVRRHRERRNVHRSFHCLVDLPTTYQPANTLLVGWQVPGRLQTIMIYGTYPRQVLDARKVRVRPTERRTENRRSALVVTQAFSKSRSVL